MNMLFDTHAHYFDRRFDEIEGGADSVLSSDVLTQTVGYIINVATNCDNALICISQAKKYPFMYTAVGIHPSDAQKDCKLSVSEEIERLKAFVCDEKTRKENKTVAIGEIGFDYYWQPVDRELQYEYFDRQMALAASLDLPVIIHDREAHGDTLEMIKRHRNVRGILHSCSMSAESVREVTRLGWFVSFSGTLTFKNASRVREACAAVPLDRLLIETDAPYLAPVPYRGKINHSALMAETARAAAEVHGLSYEKIAEITTNNARNLFGI